MNLEAYISDAIQAWLLRSGSIATEAIRNKEMAQHLNVLTSNRYLTPREVIAAAIQSSTSAEALLIMHSIQSLANDVRLALSEMAGPSATP